MSAAAQLHEDPGQKEKAEKEASKILRKLGFPEKELAMTEGQRLTKASTCLTKRLACFDDLKELLQKMTKKNEKDKGIAQPTSDRCLCFNFQACPSRAYASACDFVCSGG